MSHEPVRYADTLIFPASLDPDAVTVVRRLNEAGLESYFVGGCVRDLLLGRLPKDFDISTEARPRQIRRLFRNSRIIGRRFKLAHIHFGGKIIEVATFRRTPEGSGESAPGTPDASDDLDRPDDFEPTEAPEGAEGPDVEASAGVTDPESPAEPPEAPFGPCAPGKGLLITRDNEFGTAEEDVLRRDFTINALLYDVRSGEVIDYVGGVPDLRARRLCTIGDPYVRFAEDPVRMLRAVKFCSRLDLELEPQVEAALRESAERISQSAPPRVLEEIYKLLTCGRAERALPRLLDYGLMGRLLPEIAPWWSEHVEQLAATGHALDVIDRGRRQRSNAFLLAALWLAPWRDRMQQAPARDPLAVASDLLDSAARRMSIPRRDVAILRQQLLMQLRFESPRRSRRFRLSDFLTRPSSAESIDLLHLAALSGGADPELHARWVQRLITLVPDATAPAAEDLLAPEAGAPDDQPRAGRRRRRGGRRQRGRGRLRESRGDGLPPEGPLVRDDGGWPDAPDEPRADEASTTAHGEPGDDGALGGDGEPRARGAESPPHDGGERPPRRRRSRRGGRRHRRRGAPPGESTQRPDGPAAAGAAADGETSASDGAARESPAEQVPAATRAPAPDAAPAGPDRPNGRGRRGRRSRRGRGARPGAGQDSGGGGPAARPQRTQDADRPRRRDASGDPKPRTDGPGEKGPGQRHPEDVEDFFDW